MARLIVVAILLVSFVIGAHTEEEEKYTDKYDDVDIVSVLGNDKIRKKYQLCFLEVAPCYTPDAKFLKDTFPEAVVTKCRKCTEKQKIAFDLVVNWYLKNDLETWNSIVLKAVVEAQRKGMLRRASEKESQSAS